MENCIARLALGAVLFATGCVDLPTVPCPNSCIAWYPMTTTVLLTPGDTAQLGMHGRTMNDSLVAIRWGTTSGSASVDANGQVVALSPGRASAFARAVADTASVMGTGIHVAHPDTTSQPFITLVQDAATGDTIPRQRGFADLDSIDLTVSYVLGRNAATSGAPEVHFQTRVIDSPAVLSSLTFPLSERGKLGKIMIRVRTREVDVTGSRRFPAGYYDFFVMLRLPDGRMLGDQTGYRVRF